MVKKPGLALVLALAASIASPVTERAFAESCADEGSIFWGDLTNLGTWQLNGHGTRNQIQTVERDTNNQGCGYTWQAWSKVPSDATPSC